MTIQHAGPGDYDPSWDDEAEAEARAVALREQAEELAIDAIERGRWEPIEAMLGMAWLWELMQDGTQVDLDTLVDALIEALERNILEVSP